MNSYVFLSVATASGSANAISLFDLRAVLLTNLSLLSALLHEAASFNFSERKSVVVIPYQL